jgi:hypothetical protein
MGHPLLGDQDRKENAREGRPSLIVQDVNAPTSPLQAPAHDLSISNLNANQSANPGKIESKKVKDEDPDKKGKMILAFCLFLCGLLTLPAGLAIWAASALVMFALEKIKNAKDTGNKIANDPGASPQTQNAANALTNQANQLEADIQEFQTNAPALTIREKLAESQRLFREGAQLEEDRRKVLEATKKNKATTENQTPANQSPSESSQR